MSTIVVDRNYLCLVYKDLRYLFGIHIKYTHRGIRYFKINYSPKCVHRRMVHQLFPTEVLEQ